MDVGRLDRAHWLFKTLWQREARRGKKVASPSFANWRHKSEFGASRLRITSLSNADAINEARAIATYWAGRSHGLG